MIDRKIKIYSINPVEGQALLNYKGRLNADDLYMQVYEENIETGELVNLEEGKEKDGIVFNADCLSTCA